MSRLNFLIRSSSSTILVLIPLAFPCSILRQPLLLTLIFLDGAAWRRSPLSTPLLFALVEQFSQCQEPLDMCMLCSPLDILEQLLWQVRRHPMQTSGLGEYLTTFRHCRHRFLGALVPESLGAPIGCPTSVGTVDGRGGVQERGGTQSLQVQFPGVCDTRLRPLHFYCLCEVAMNEPHLRCGLLVLSVLPQGLQNSPGPGFASTSPAFINSIRTTRAGRCPDHRKTPVSVGGRRFNRALGPRL